MKTLLSTLTLSFLIVGLAQAEIAIDGKDYEKTISVTINNFDRVEAAVNFNKWASKGIMNSKVDLTDYYRNIQQNGHLPTEAVAQRWNEAVLRTLGLNLDRKTKKQLAKALPGACAVRVLSRRLCTAKGWKPAPLLLTQKL